METFGLDLGSQIIKIVQLEPNGQNFQLKAVGSAPSTFKGLLSDAENDLNNLASIVKKLHTELKITTKNVAVALPDDQTITRLITLPALSAEELESALKWEAEQYVPFPLSDATLSYQVLGKTAKDNNQQMEILLVAALNRVIDKTVKVLRTAGLNPVSLETEMLALTRSLMTNDQEVTLMIDLGAKATDIAIVDRGQLVFTRSMSTAGEAITRAIASDLGLELMQAEEYKRAYGVRKDKLEGKVATVIEPVLEAVAKEVEQAIQFFQSTRKDQIIKRAVLSGGTSFLPEIVGWMTSRIGIETQIGNPFSKVAASDLLTRVPKETWPIYGVAAGLAMKQL